MVAKPPQCDKLENQGYQPVILGIFAAAFLPGQ
jgi:hypothetical protein